MNEYAENLLVHFRRIESLKKEALSYQSVNLNSRQLCDLELLLNRAFYPLTGYLNRDDYESVLNNMRLSNGSIWPIPVCLDVDEKTVEGLKKGQSLALRDQEGFMLAVLKVGDIWKPDKQREAVCVYGTDNAEQHPGVQKYYEETDSWYVGGDLEGLHLPIHYDFRELRLAPAETHRRFSESGWRNVIAYHTNKYLHKVHKEMAMTAAREAGAHIIFHPAVELRHPGDLEHFTRICCYKEFVKKISGNMVMLGLIPLIARSAGPREALWQAVIRKNYGCTHFMVEVDHGDPFEDGDSEQRFYPRHKAQELLREFEEEIGIKMIPLKEMVYVDDKAQYIAKDEVPPGMSVKHISATELKRRLENALDIPEWFSYPEVLSELRRAYPSRTQQGFTIFMTGLSGSGKSTLAKVLVVKFMEMRGRPVTLLDGDIVRRNLSSELSFSQEHRNLNIIRIGFVASEITKNGGIAICAPIAPYEEPRRQNREIISRYGGYVEIYVSTPLETCEQRDRKGLYAKARAGKVKGVTGISDPYIPPSNPEITIDTSKITPEEAAQEVILYLVEEGYIS